MIEAYIAEKPPQVELESIAETKQPLGVDYSDEFAKNPRDRINREHYLKTLENLKETTKCHPEVTAQELTKLLTDLGLTSQHRLTEYQMVLLAEGDGLYTYKQLNENETSRFKFVTVLGGEYNLIARGLRRHMRQAESRPDELQPTLVIATEENRPALAELAEKYEVRIHN